MSFLVDPALLYADGQAYARVLPESAQGGAAKLAGGAAVATFLGVGIGAYLDQAWARPLWKPFGARSGRDFMLGWPVVYGRRRRPSTRTDALAAAIFATYPLWWWLGWDHGRRARPQPA